MFGHVMCCYCEKQFVVIGLFIWKINHNASLIAKTIYPWNGSIFIIEFNFVFAQCCNHYLFDIIKAIIPGSSRAFQNFAFN